MLLRQLKLSCRHAAAGRVVLPCTHACVCSMRALTILSCTLQLVHFSPAEPCHKLTLPCNCCHHCPCPPYVPPTPQSKVDSFLLAVFVLVAPAICYLAIHASVINNWMHFWSLLILGSVPLLYICAIPQGLWWVPMPPRLITGLSRLLMVLAAFGVLAGRLLGHSTHSMVCVSLECAP